MELPELTQVLLCCVVLLREAVKAEVCQSSTETRTQAGVAEVPVDGSLLARKQNSWQCITMLGRERQSSSVVLWINLSWSV